MLGRAWLIVALMMGAAFAGCIGGEEAPAETPAEQQSVDDTLDANETTTAPDGRGDIAAFKETNKTETGTGGMMHAHDYWGADTRKILTQRDMWFIPLPLVPCRSGSFPNGECYPPGTSIADIDIPEPNLVFEGTDHIEVLFDNLRIGPGCLSAMPACPVPNSDMPAHPAIKMKFDYITAADEPTAWRTGPDVTPGTPAIIPVRSTEADMPHQQKSLWIFRIYTDNNPGPAVSVLFNFTVTAVKGNQIVNWPPHPNLYADKTERIIFDGPAKTETKGWAEYWVNGNDGNWFYPERVISYGTDRLEITVSDVKFNSQVPVPPDYFYLDFHNASFLSKMGNGDLSGGRAFDEGTDGQTWHFVIPVDGYGMDTPYGQKSRWAFRFLARYSEDSCPDVDQSIQQGCQWFPYTMDYHLKIVAYGHSTAEGVEDANTVQTAAGTEPTPSPTPPTA